MHLARVTAAIVFLKGFLPLVVLGAWRPGGWFLLAAALVCASLAYGLWTGRRWALPLGFVLMLPQLFIISSPLVSWRFFVGVSLRVGIKPALDLLNSPLIAYYRVGGDFFFADEYNAAFASTVGTASSMTWVCVNFVAMAILVLLVAQWYVTPNHALQRTGISGDTTSDVQA